MNGNNISTVGEKFRCELCQKKSKEKRRNLLEMHVEEEEDEAPP